MIPKMIGSQKHIAQFDLRGHIGRVFVTSDLHGHYHLLHEKLREVAFDSAKDLLFVGGDWCDRHPDSQYVLDYIYEPWIHSIQANHEQMVIDYIEALALDDMNHTRQCYQMLFCNGGEWFFDISDSKQMAIYEAFKSLPLSIELLLPNDVKVGIIHADCPYNDWEQWKNITTAEFNWNGKATAQWSRSNIDRGVPVKVKGVDFLLTGHTPTKSGEIEKLGNQVYADLGSFFRDKISLIELNDEFIKWVKED